MFWTIVGALAFFFIGLPIIFACITSKAFWKGLGGVILFLVFIGGWVFLENSDKPSKTRGPTPPTVTPSTGSPKDDYSKIGPPTRLSRDTTNDGSVAVVVENYRSEVMRTLIEISLAKHKFALGLLREGKDHRQTPTENDLAKYISGGQFPVHPPGGRYIINGYDVEPESTVFGKWKSE